jgi:hypothetical protein
VKRTYVIGFLVAAGLLVAGALVVGQTKGSRQAIRSSVTRGLTLDELAEVARANTKRKITVLRDLSEEQFRCAHSRLYPG